MLLDACSECGLAIILSRSSVLCTTTTESVRVLMGQEVTLSQQTK